MPYDISEILEDIKSQLSTAEQRDTKQINTALGLCLDDLRIRMKSVSMVEQYTVTVAANSRTVTLTGDNDDLESIYYLKWSTGDSQKLLYYKPINMFLEKYDSPSASQNDPAYYTVLLNQDGMPIVKFDCPTDASDTLTVYYIREPAPQTVARLRNKIAIVEGALAYFYGSSTDKGQIHYGRFRELVKLSRESDPFMAKPTGKMILSKFHRDTRKVIWAGHDRRRY